MKLCAYTDHLGQCRAPASHYAASSTPHARGYCPSHRRFAHMPAPVAIASYDGASASGRTHLVRFADGLASTACGDGWEASRATPHTLPTNVTCTTCRRVLNIARTTVRDAGHLLGLLGMRSAPVHVIGPGEVAS